MPEAAQTRDRNKLIENHVDLIGPIARMLKMKLPASFELDDLIATGYLALVEAADNYRPAEHGGAPFSAYVRFKVRAEILESVRRKQYRAATHRPAEEAPEPASTPQPEATIDRARQLSQVMSEIELLPRQQRQIVRNYYGPEEPRFADVASQARISRQYAGQLHAEAIGELRRKLSSLEAA